MEGGEIHYATAKDWQDIMKNRSKLRMHELIERLGLRARWSSNKRGKTNFESTLVRDLVVDMGDVIATVPKDADELVKFLAAEGSLRDEVEELLEKHGAAIWGRMSEREHLLSVGEPDVEAELYPRDLYFESEEDRELIRVLLHWWLGLKACNVILARERLDRERRKKEESRRARAAGEHESAAVATPASFVTLAPNTGIPVAPTLNTAIGGPAMPPVEAARHMQVFQLDTKMSRGSPISPAMLTPPESSESPIVANRDGNHPFALHTNPIPNAQAQSVIEGVWNRLASGPVDGSRTANTPLQLVSTIAPYAPPSVAPHPSMTVPPQPAMDASQSAIRQIGAELANLVSHFLTDEQSAGNGHVQDATSIARQPGAGASSRNGTTYAGLDLDTLHALRNYLYREENSMTLDEQSLLRRLEVAWRDGVRADHVRIEENPGQFIERERALLTWIELRRHLADLDRADKRWREEGTTAPEIERRIAQHKTLMGATRELIRVWEEIGGGAAKLSPDEVLRQAFMIVAGEKYAMEMEWRRVDVTGVVRWLAEHLEQFREEEQEEGEGLYYVG